MADFGDVLMKLSPNYYKISHQIIKLNYYFGDNFIKTKIRGVYSCLSSDFIETKRR